MIKCAKCGAELEEGQKFCFNCGTPVPQVKKCVSCGAELGLNMKFCPYCGANQDGSQKAAGAGGFSMGSKNVIAGDVIGHKEETHVAGNATIIKNEDQTKQTRKCHVCGKITAVVRGFDCPSCGEFTCEDCYDSENNCCKSCAKNKTEGKLSQYKKAVEEALADGKIELEERRKLIALQRQLGIDAEKARKIENEVKNGKVKSADELTTVEKINLKKAAELFYKKNQPEKAFELASEVYERHQNSENVLDIYLPVLAEVDPKKAKEIISNLQFDVLVAYITRISIALKEKDFVAAEEKLSQALKIWSENSLVKCFQSLYNFALYKNYEDFSFFEKAAKIAEDFGEAKNPLELSYQVKVQAMLQEEAGEEPLEADENFCEENGIYWRIMQSDPISNVDRNEIYVGKGDGFDFAEIQKALDYAAENAVVHVAPGVYKEHLVFKKKVHLIGLEESIKQKSSDELPIVVLDPEKSCELDVASEIEGIVFTHEENLEFDNLQEFAEQKLEFDDEDYGRIGGTYGDDDFRSLLWVKTNSRLKNIAVLCSDSYGITFSGRDAELEDSVIFHCSDSNIQCAENSNPKILNCNISNCMYLGVYLKNDSEPEISGCDIYNHLSSGIWIKGNSKGTYADCKIHDNESEGIGITDSSEPEITGCEIFDNKQEGITIFSNSKPKIVDCKIHDNKTEGKGYSGIIADAESEPEINGCDIYNHLAYGIWIKDNAKGTYKNCKVHDNESQGIEIQDSSEPEVTACYIFDNKKNGITIYNNSKPKIVDCKIHDNKTEGEGYPGIVIFNDSEPEINGCDIYNHLSDGIWIKDNAKGTYKNCKIHDNEQEGIEIEDSSEPDVTGCEIFDNKQNGIVIYNDSKPKIVDCKIHDNEFKGIGIKDSSEPEITGCEIFDGKHNGIVIYNNSKPKIVDCKIHDNKTEGEGYPGVVALGDSEPEINGCEIYNHLAYGIWIEDNAKGTYKNCKIHDNSGQGVCKDSSHYIDTSSCKEWNNGK